MTPAAGFRRGRPHLAWEDSIPAFLGDFEALSFGALSMIDKMSEKA
jgi:hypothetical protein